MLKSVENTGSSTPLGHNLTGIRKVVVSPDSVWTDLDELEVHSVGEDENWTYLDDQHGCSYDDIIVYEGKVCVVDWSGTISLIDSSFRTQKFSPSICSGGNCEHLVASSGDLYVVDRYFSRDLYGLEDAFDFRVYSLDRQRGKWAEVRSLSNMAFFLTRHRSYSISMHKLRGHNGDCMYLAGRTNSQCSGDEVIVFGLPDRSITRLVFSNFLMRNWRSPSLSLIDTAISILSIPVAFNARELEPEDRDK